MKHPGSSYCPTGSSATAEQVSCCYCRCDKHPSTRPQATPKTKKRTAVATPPNLELHYVLLSPLFALAGVIRNPSLICSVFFVALDLLPRSFLPPRCRCLSLLSQLRGTFQLGALLPCFRECALYGSQLVLRTLQLLGSHFVLL